MRKVRYIQGTPDRTATAFPADEWQLGSLPVPPGSAAPVRPADEGFIAPATATLESDDLDIDYLLRRGAPAIVAASQEDEILPAVVVASTVDDAFDITRFFLRDNRILYRRFHTDEPLFVLVTPGKYLYAESIVPTLYADSIEPTLMGDSIVPTLYAESLP